MECTLSTDGPRIRQARFRLHNALGPRSAVDRELILYLTRALSMPGALEAFVDLVEHAVISSARQARDDASLRERELEAKPEVAGPVRRG